MHLDELMMAMVQFDRGDAMRIQHLTKVHAYAAMIGRAEGLDAATQHVVEAAAIVHDIGIKPALEKYGHCHGKAQEELGPAPARAMLLALGEPETVADRVELLVANHHTLTPVLGIDHQILLEADFLVNLCEEQSDRDAVMHARDKVFKTACGTALLNGMFGL